MNGITIVPRLEALGLLVGLVFIGCSASNATQDKPLVSATFAETEKETSWILAGSKPREYEIFAAPDPSGAKRQIQTLRYTAGASGGSGFGTLMQMFVAEKYKGKRLRFSATVETKDVAAWAGLWMRVDAGHEMRGFDNMQRRPIKGTKPKARYEVVLDVAEDATAIALGILIHGSGEATLSSPTIEIVGPSVPVTGTPPKPLGDFQP